MKVNFFRSQLKNEKNSTKHVQNTTPIFPTIHAKSSYPMALLTDSTFCYAPSVNGALCISFYHSTFSWDLSVYYHFLPTTFFEQHPIYPHFLVAFTWTSTPSRRRPHSRHCWWDWELRLQPHPTPSRRRPVTSDDRYWKSR